MKVLVIGSGGREHALVWKLAQSPNVEKIYCSPGNGGIAAQAECLPALSHQELLSFAKKEKISLTIVGPEQPLVEGIVDLFKQEGLVIFGPSKQAAQLEGSKAFAKEFMNRCKVPTASYKSFDNLENALIYLDEISFPTVVKADGLAAGKGVVIAKSKEQAQDAVRSMLKDNAFGEAGSKVVIESCLQGEEISVLALVDGKTIRPLESSQDHKRIFDNDEGPNTGGMGAISPSPLYDLPLRERIQKEVLEPVLKELQKEGLSFHGILYAGLMIDPSGVPNVLEFNVRFGDPETQAVLMRLDSDLAELMLATAEERLAEAEIKWKEESAVCVVVASGGYPGQYDKGKEISGLDQANACEEAFVFHAGTALDQDKIVTSGGRVLGVTALGKGLSQAQERAYQAAAKINFEGAFYRKDIGNKALKAVSS